MQNYHDPVPLCNQDSINGFDSQLLENLLNSIELENCQSILDAMAGDGNLSTRILKHCKDRAIIQPKMTYLEYSLPQYQIARTTLEVDGVECIHGDILTMCSLDTKSKIIPDESFDCVIIKSGTHEIPLADQPKMYEQIFRVLKPKGIFVNLGMVFSNENERDEFKIITSVKDKLAGMKNALQNRHFLMKSEFYALLRNAGFINIKNKHNFNYKIHSKIANDAYFKKSDTKQPLIALQESQISSLTLRKNNRIVFEGEHSIMFLPGEITIAQKT